MEKKKLVDLRKFKKVRKVGNSRHYKSLKIQRSSTWNEAIIAMR
jgi:hypothetical protein